MIGVLALVLALLELVLLAVVVVIAAGSWRKLKPTVGPLLAMFAPSTSEPAAASSSTSVRCAYCGSPAGDPHAGTCPIAKP